MKPEGPIGVSGERQLTKGRGRLLIADDNALDRTVLASRLRNAGYEIGEESEGRQVMARLEREDFDLVLLDSLMPGLEGLEILEAIKGSPRWNDLPVIIISGLDEHESVTASIEKRAEDYVSSPFDPGLLIARIEASLAHKRLREKEALFTRQLKLEKEHSERLVNAVIPIGISLLKEKDYHRLMDRVLVEAKDLCHADGGTLYLMKENQLHFVLLKNDSLKIEMDGLQDTAPFPPLNLYDPVTGEPNHSQVACHVALDGLSINIPNAYDVQGYDFQGTRLFDERTGYKSISFLTTPLKNDQGEVIGVLQLINAKNPDLGIVIPFELSLQRSVESLADLAAAAMENTAAGKTSL